MKMPLIKPLAGVLLATSLFGGPATIASAHALPATKPAVATRATAEQRDHGPNVQSGANLQSGANVQSGSQATGGGADGEVGAG